MLNTNAIVFWFCAAVAVFWIGLETGIDEAKGKLATQCLEQPGAKLTSTVQGRSRTLICNYGGGYAKAAIRKDAT